MSIDWFTVIAQIVNFLILMWLLKRFLYKPILNAIDARDKKIKTQIQDAETKSTEAQKERDAFHKKSTEFDQQRKAMFTKMTEEAQAKRKQLLEDARKEGEELRTKLAQALQEEQQNLSNDIVLRTQKEVFAIARKVLADLASTSLEEQMTRVFIEQLKDLADDQKAQLVSALQGSSDPPVVRSAFELPEARRTEIESAVKEFAATDVKLRFDVAEDKISGIELSCGGYKIAWSIAEYLTSLETRIAGVVNEGLVAGAPVDPDQISSE